MQLNGQATNLLLKMKKSSIRSEDSLTRAKSRIYSKTKDGKKKFYYNPSLEYLNMKNGKLNEANKEKRREVKQILGYATSISRALSEGLNRTDKVFVGINEYKPLFRDRKPEEVFEDKEVLMVA